MGILSSKKTVTEQGLASEFLKVVSTLSDLNWQQVCADLSQVGDYDLTTIPEAKEDWTNAFIAQELQALPNLMEAEQSERIKSKVLETINDRKSVTEIRDFEAAFQEAVNSKFSDTQVVLHAIPNILLVKWFKDKAYAEFNGKQTTIVDLLAATALAHSLIVSGGLWGGFVKRYKIIKD